MLNKLHDLHLIFDLVVERTILHELSLVQLFGSVRLAAVSRRHLVHGGEGPSPDLADFLILAGLGPTPAMARQMQCVVGDQLGRGWTSSGRRSRPPLRYGGEQVDGTFQTGNNGGRGVVVEHRQLVQIPDEVLPVGNSVLALTTRNPHQEVQVVGSFVHQDLDDGPAVEGPRDVAGVPGFLLEKPFVHDGTVGGLILQHENAVLVEVYAKVDVAKAAERIVGEGDVAVSRVPTERESHGGILDVGRQAQDDGMRARLDFARRLEGIWVIVLVIVEPSLFYIISRHNMQRAFLPDPADLFPRVVGVWYQKADDIRQIFVREPGVLLA